MKPTCYAAEAESIGFLFSEQCSALYMAWIVETVPVEAYQVPTFRAIRRIVEDMEPFDGGIQGIAAMKAKADIMKLRINPDDLLFAKDGTKSKDAREAVTCAKLVVREHEIRQRTTGLEEIARLGKDATTDEQKDRWEKEAPAKVSELFVSVETKTVDIDSVCRDVIDEIEDESNGIISKIPSQYQELDMLLDGGFSRGDLVIIGARPSMGKTSFACNLAINFATLGMRGLIVSAEMKKTLIARKMVQIKGQLTRSEIISNQCSFYNAVKSLAELPIRINDDSGIDIDKLASICRREKVMGDVDYIIVDYLQMIICGKGDTMNERMGYMSRTMKELARQLDVAFISLSQLNRGLETRTNKRPIMADLRESGAIEQDADVISFIYRDGVYNRETPLNNTELIIGKNRNGRTGTVYLDYDLQRQSFHERR